MFNALWNCLSHLGLGHFSNIVSHLDEIVGLLGEEYKVDGNAKDAAIDAIIEILKQHKSKKS